MPMRLKTAALSAAALLIFASAAFAQVSSIEGDVKGEDGTPFKGALVKIERKDIKGHYQVKSDKKGHYFHTGLPLGNYKLVSRSPRRPSPARSARNRRAICRPRKRPSSRRQ